MFAMPSIQEFAHLRHGVSEKRVVLLGWIAHGNDALCNVAQVQVVPRNHKTPVVL